MQTPSNSEQNGESEVSWRDSYKTAQMVALPDVTRVCGAQVGQLVRDLAQGAGCPEEYIVMPLLACCSALMGTCSEVRVHSAWSEPPVLWCVVGTRAGTRRSTALRQVVMPLLAIHDQLRRRRRCQRGADSDVLEEFTLPAVFTGTLGFPELRSMVEEGAGSVVHVTERAEDSHRRLGISPGQTNSATRAQLHDLYEALPGDIVLQKFDGRDMQNNDREQKFSETLAQNRLSQAICFNHCGFAEPEHVVNLVVKCPAWLSGRLLVSCPSVLDNTPSSFSVPEQYTFPEDSVNGGPKALTLRDVYRRIAGAHKDGICYVFTQDAVNELQQFQEEEWSTIVAQLGGEEQEGAVSKSLGHIVRLAGVLKALSLAAQSDADDSEISAQEPAAKKRKQDSIEGDILGATSAPGPILGRELLAFDQKQIEIDYDDITRAIELGKYFLEQKLSMTFMVSTGFFRTGSITQNNRQSQQQQQQREQEQQQQRRQSSEANNAGNRSMGQMLPPLLPGQGGQMGVGGPPGGFGLPLGLPGVPLMGMGGGGGQSQLGTPTNPLLQQQQLAPYYPPQNFGGSSSSRSQTPSKSSAASSSSSSPPGANIDVTQLPATWAPSTPEEELAEMSAAAEFVQLEPAQFVAVHARRVKRLLECFDDGCGVSATTAAQKSIAPPVRVAGTNNRHPAWASALFFQKVADLGLGYAEQVRHPTNGRVYWRFRRKPMAELTEKNTQLLQYLRIDMVRYSRQGQPTMHVPGLDADAMSPAGGTGGDTMGSGAGLIDEGASNSSSKGDKSPVSQESPNIKQEVL